MFCASFGYARRRPETATRNVQLCGLGGSDPPGTPAAGHPETRGPGVGRDVETVRSAVLGGGSAIDSAGTALARPVVTGVLLDSQREPAHGTARLQPAVPLVRGPGDRRPSMGSDCVQQEPGPAVESGCSAIVLRTSEATGGGLDVG